MSDVNITKALSDPLTIDQVDFRVQSISAKGWATILAYKDARVDMNRLNSVFGVGGWQKKYELINGNLFCSVGIKSGDQWAWVQDVGTESNTEKEKGQASDAFKRACFNLGIGIELYDYPRIFIKLNENEFYVKTDSKGKERGYATWDLALPKWRWESQFADGKITYLRGLDSKNTERFVWEDFGPKADLVNKVVKQNRKSIKTIKDNIATQDIESAVEAWGEISQEEKMALWISPTEARKLGINPVFTTDEIKVMRSNEWSASALNIGEDNA